MLTRTCTVAESEKVTLNYVLVLAKCQDDSMTLIAVEL